MSTDNPWGVTPSQAECIDLYVQHGCMKLALRHWRADRSEKTFEVHVAGARARMMLADPTLRTPLLCYFAWRDWRRNGAKP